MDEDALCLYAVRILLTYSYLNIFKHTLLSNNELKVKVKM